MYNEAQKKAIYKWRETNREEYLDYHNAYRKNSIIYNEKQKAIMRRKAEIRNYKDYGNYEKISKIFRNILI
jgi:hypothetical protein